MADSLLSISILKLLLSMKRDDVQREIEQIEQAPQLAEKLKQMKKEINRLQQENEGLKQKSKTVDRDNYGHKFTEKKLLETERELEKTKLELEDASKRLSQLMGSKLTDNNPAIADLSDVNRPQKLAQRYSELYDNQWTDAFDILQGESSFRDERQTVAMLLKILTATVNWCKRSAEMHKRNIINTLFMSKDEDRQLSSTQTKLIKDVMKVTAPESGQRLFEEYMSKLGREHDLDSRCALRDIPYLQECFSICWLMCVQDPPVVFGPLPRQGDAFDKTAYKEYTQGGTRVDYIVWPVMLLHQDGSVLCRGVAQCKKSHDPTVVRPRSAWVSTESPSYDSYSEKHEDQIRRRDRRAVKSTVRSTKTQYVLTRTADNHDEFSELINDFLFYIQYVSHDKAKQKLGAEKYHSCYQYCIQNGLIER